MRLSKLGWVVVPVLVATACGSAVLGGGSGSGSTPAASVAASPHASTHSPSAGATTAPAVVTASEKSTPDGGRIVELPLPGGAYTPSAPSGGTDDYHCFLLDPQIDKDTFMTSVAFLPGNASVVHHAILFRVPPESVAAVKAKDAETAVDGWSCFGDSGVPRQGDAVESLNDAPWLAAWAPGGKGTTFTDGTGVQMDKGTQIVLQVHYNLLAGDGPDSSGVRLDLAKPGTELTPLETMLMPAPVELPCPDGVTGPLCDRNAAVADVVSRFGPGAGRTIGGLQMLCGGDLYNPPAGPTQTCDRTMREPMTIVAAAAHMHLLGRTIHIDKVARDGTVTTLIDKPVWDFDDQGSTKLPEPVKVVPGDHIRITCTHDATLRDMIPSLKGQEPRYVVWGEGTSDEMCLGILTVIR